MRTRRKYTEALTKDSGDVPLVFFLYSLPVFLISLGYVISTMNAFQEKQEHTNAAQEAVKSAIRKVDARGSLTVASVNEFMRAHREILQREGLAHKECTSAFIYDDLNGTKGAVRNFPIYQISISEKRGLDKDFKTMYVAYGQSPPPFSEKQPRHNTKKVQRVITVRVTTAIVEPMAWWQECRPITSEVSAIAFGNKADLRQELAAFRGVEPFEESPQFHASRNTAVSYVPGLSLYIDKRLVLISETDPLLFYSGGKFGESLGKKVDRSQIGYAGYKIPPGDHPDKTVIRWRYCFADRTDICPGTGSLEITWKDKYGESGGGGGAGWNDGKPVPDDWYLPGTGPGAGLDATVYKKISIYPSGHANSASWFKDYVTLGENKEARNLRIITPAGVDGLVGMHNYQLLGTDYALFHILKLTPLSDIPKIFIYQYDVCEKGTDNCEMKRTKVRRE